MTDQTRTHPDAAPVTLSLAEQIKAASDIPTETIDVPEWGVKVEVRGMDGDDTLRFMEQATEAGEGKASFAALYPEIIMQACYDPANGERVFSEGDWEWLRTKSGAALNRIATKAMALSGLTEEAAGEAGKDS